METRILTLDEQLVEIRDEFYDEAEKFKANRSSIERQQAANHINALLDAYNLITVDLAWAEHAAGTE